MSSLVITKETGNFFSLVLDGGSPIISEQNRLTTIGNLCNFKTANGANLILKQNILYSDITIITGGSHVPTSIQDLWVSLIDAGFFDGLGSGSGGTGAERFTELLDTFNSYLGRDGQVLVVNESMQRIETVEISLFTPEEKAKLEGIETGAQVNVNADWNETNPSSKKFIENKPPQLLNAVGTFHYADLATQTTPISVTSGVETLLTNDALGAYTNISNAPYGVPTVYNADTNEFDFSSLSVGDIIHFRPDLNIDLTGTNTSYELYLKGSIGTAKEWILDLTSGGERKSTAEFHKNGFMGFDIAFEEMTTAPSQLFIKTDANATVKVNGWYIEVLRKNINVVNIAFDGIIETKRFTPTGQVCTLPTGAVAVNAHIDGYIQYPEQAGFESDLNTFTQSGDDVTFNTTLDGTPQILITYNL